MRAHVLTRGWRRQDDYTFFPGPPQDRWWEEYGEHADFDYPVLLVETAGDRQWRAYVGGVPTSREDVVGTPIRLSLVAGGECGCGPGPALVAALVEERVRELAGERAVAGAGDAIGRPATDCLDQAFGEKAVADLFAGRASAGDLVDDAAEAYATAVPTTAPVRVHPEPPATAWVAGLTGAGARDAFLATVRDLVMGDAVGRALLLNSLDGHNAIPRPRGVERLAVLDGSPTERIGPDPVAIQGKVPESAEPGRAGRPLTWAALAGVAVVGGAAVIRQSRRRRRGCIPIRPAAPTTSDRTSNGCSS
ncbi:hypothetical protein [Streptomyces sp. NPDC001070]